MNTPIDNRQSPFSPNNMSDFLFTLADIRPHDFQNYLKHIDITPNVITRFVEILAILGNADVLKLSCRKAATDPPNPIFIAGCHLPR